MHFLSLLFGVKMVFCSQSRLVRSHIRRRATSETLHESSYISIVDTLLFAIYFYIKCQSLFMRYINEREIDRVSESHITASVNYSSAKLPRGEIVIGSYFT